MEESLRPTGGDRRELRTLLTLALLIIAFAAFLKWGVTESELTVQGVIVAVLTLGMFTLALVLAVPNAIRFFSGAAEHAPRPAGDRSSARRRLHPVLGVMLTVLAARAAVVVIAYIFARVFSQEHGSVFSSLERIWLKLDTDAPHYIDIAENGYVTSGDQMYSLVFLPLFPALIRLFNYIFGSSFASAMFINTLASCGAAAVIYELALLDTGRRSARFAVVFTFAMPAAIFFIAPMSEALFLLLSALALYCMRRERFLLAALFGALAALTRSLGLILLMPYIAEAAACLVRKKKSGESKPGFIVLLIGGAVIICLGTFVYLIINKLLWGEWFKFMEFQRDIWYQRPALFFDTAALQVDMLFASFGVANDEALGLWLPNLLFIFGALAVFVSSARTLRTSYSLYFAAYFAVACGASWLLSAPRYLTALVVLPLALAHLCESRDDGVALGRARAKAAVVTVLLVIGQLFYLLMYTADYCIY
ncbi:MAG: glycosyltransferase family 39 protein [Clostridia bacterium]|nr:glycosyltransferase family 39 protein [Clostridia bacterium]